MQRRNSSVLFCSQPRAPPCPGLIPPSPSRWCRSCPVAPPDIIACAIAELRVRWGQSVVVDNRGGAAASSVQETARAAPDGYNLGSIATVSTTATAPAINPGKAVQRADGLHACHQRGGYA